MSDQRERDQKMSDDARAVAAEKESEHPNANDATARVYPSTPEQAYLAQESDIEVDESAGVPGQIQYPEDSDFGRRAGQGKEAETEEAQAERQQKQQEQATSDDYPDRPYGEDKSK